MMSLPEALPTMLAEAVEVENFPLGYQIACILFAACFLWSFSIARDPRGWRRLYQSRFTRKEDFSVNKNKHIDEQIRRYGIPVSMVFLVAAVLLFVLGVTYRYRHTQKPVSREDRFRVQDTQRILEKKTL